jgi:hypothetical protein
MLAAIGTTALGVVWGWLLRRLVPGRPWPVLARLAVAVLGQAALIWQLLEPLGILWFLLGGLFGMVIAHLWLASIKPCI